MQTKQKQQKQQEQKSIEKSQNEQNQAKQQNEDNQQQGQKKKRKRRRKKKLKKHPPQFYQEKRLLKQMKQRQNLWNDRFNYQSLPRLSDIDVQIPKTRPKLKSLRQSQSREIKIYRTFNVQNQDNRAKPSRSFNIRVINKKQEKEQNYQSKKQIKTIQKKVEQEEEFKLKKLREQLIQEVKKIHSELNFSECHRDYLIHLIENSNKVSIKNYIRTELSKFKNKTSTCITLQNAIKKRENIIQQFKQYKENANPENIKKYRLGTIRVIQQILKWKQEAENAYQEHAKMKPKLNFLVKGENYLLKMAKDLNIPGVFEKYEANPFLLGYQNNPVDNELIIKIRACQMLLLEQQIDNS